MSEKAHGVTSRNAYNTNLLRIVTWVFRAGKGEKLLAAWEREAALN